MYEHMTFEFILDDMLSDVSPDQDKRPGSPIYNALAPAAAKLADAYRELDNVVLLGFPQTAKDADKGWLDFHAEEQGVYREKAKKAQRKASFNVSVNKDELFFVDNLAFVVKVAGTDAVVECETAGEIGNQPLSGTPLLAANNIPGLTVATLGDIILPGEEEETNESLFIRYLEKINKQPTSGNQYHYYQWAKEVDGVGDARVFPLWNGDNTVKVVIVDHNKAPASPELVAEVQNYIDPGSRGLGEGVAPIGCFCTVESAKTKGLVVSASVSLAPGQTIESATLNAEEEIKSYLKSIAFKEDILRYVQIGNIIFNTSGVVDYKDLVINGSTTNIVLLPDEVPVLEEVILSVF
jgi:uncharacterized phage protein gp47/JayE